MPVFSPKILFPIKYINKAIAKTPRDQKKYLQSSYQLLGYDYLEKKDFKKALEILNKTLKIEADSSETLADIYCGIAQAYFGLNKIRRAIKFGLKALDEDFDEDIEEKIYFLLAFCYGMWGVVKNRKKEEYFTAKLRTRFPHSPYLRELEENRRF